MATSGTKTYNPTVQNIIDEALLNLGVIGFGDSPPTDIQNAALAAFEKLLKSLQNGNVFVERYLTQSYNTTASTNTIDISAENWEHVQNANIKVDGVFRTFEEMSLEQFEDLAQPDSEGIPTHYIISGDKKTCYLYPTPDAVYAVYLYGQTAIEDATSGTNNVSLDSAASRMLVTELTHIMSSMFRKPLEERMYWKQLAQTERVNYLALQTSASMRHIKAGMEIV